MKIFAIDPGCYDSAFTVWNGEKIIESNKVSNDELYWKLETYLHRKEETLFCIEKIQGYGMPVGKEIFETVFFSGRLFELCFSNMTNLSQVPRKDVKLHLCGVLCAKDSNVSAAIRERFGEKPTKKRPNPIYNGHKISADQWQSWALAITVFDQIEIEMGTK